MLSPENIHTNNIIETEQVTYVAINEERGHEFETE